MDYGEIVLRLLSAVSIGCIIGIDRIRQSKPTGIKTLGLVALGAGVIVRAQGDSKVHGLTTAASIRITAALGIVCGMESWQIAGVALTIVLILFFVGRLPERTMHRR